VLLRYALGDVARLTRERCPHCGALTERLTSLPRRVDGLLKIKGMLVNPQALVDAVLEPALLDFQAVVDKENPDDPLSMDRLRLRIVPAVGADAALDGALALRVQRAIGVTPVVERTVADDPLLVGRGWKTKPILDLRK
jgi:phenylacetate-coenzyme A ligase PaaK-like adenylate-forming protein